LDKFLGHQKCKAFLRANAGGDSLGFAFNHKAIANLNSLLFIWNIKSSLISNKPFWAYFGG